MGVFIMKKILDDYFFYCDIISNCVEINVYNGGLFMNKKTKLGISATALLALVYAMGAASTLGMIALIVFILIFEEDEDLKAATKKAATVLLILLLINGCERALIEILRLFADGYSSVLYTITDKMDYFFEFAINAAYMVFAFLALNGAFFNKPNNGAPYYPQQPNQGYGQPMQNQAPKMQNPGMQNQGAQGSSYVQDQGRRCPKCGNPVGDELFCTYCGTKL